MTTSKIYLATPEAAIVFDASGTGDVLMSMDSTVITNQGWQSAQHDLGTSPRAFLFRWRAEIKLDTAPIVGESVDFYYKSGLTATTELNNDDGTGDIVLSHQNKLRNCHPIGSVLVDEAVDNTMFVGSGVIAIYEQFINIICWNDTSETLSTVEDECRFFLTPLSMQGQAT